MPDLCSSRPSGAAFGFVRIARQSGFAVGYLMASLSLLGILSVATVGMTRNSQAFKMEEQHTATLVSQLEQIRTALIWCGVVYPAGNNGTGFNIKYPAGSTAVNAAALTCPGDPGANKNIFQGRKGGYLDPVPNGFGAWQYINDANGIRLSIASNGSSSSSRLLSKLSARYTSASFSSVTNTMTFVILD